MENCAHISEQVTATYRIKVPLFDTFEVCSPCCKILRKRFGSTPGLEVTDLRSKGKRVIKIPLVTPAMAPLTEYEWKLVQKVSGASFPVGHAHKRFMRRLTKETQLSDRGRQYMAFIANRYRRQYKLNAEDLEYIQKWIYQCEGGSQL